MEREERYIVIKKSDLQAALANKRLDQVHEDNLVDLIERLATQRFASNKKALTCVVVESDWPEYERVWKMIEARVNMENQHKAINLNDGVMLPASRICQACIQDAHEEGYDIEAGMFGPHFSKEMVEINNWRKKAELFDKLRGLMGYVQNGTDTSVTLFQDDATLSFNVSVGVSNNRKGVSAPSIEAAIMKADKEFGGE